MNPSLPISRADFENLLTQYQQLIDLANDLEYQIYRLGELPVDERVSNCQRAAGSLIGLLRDFLFRQDQQVMPLIESAYRR
jgi:hypothetical protein